MSDPVGERLRSYYQSVQGNAPARLEARVTRVLDSAPWARPARVPRASGRPAFGLLAAGAAVIIVALVVRKLGSAPMSSPSSITGPSTSPSASPSPGPSGSLNTSPPGPTPTQEATLPATPTLTESPAATPLRSSGNLVRVGAMTPYLSGPAVTLGDSTILIVGGMTIRSDGMRLKTNLAELYKMSSHTFEPTGPMADARYGHSATLLDDGRVLVVGGADLMDGIDNLATAEVYDPATGRFTRTGSMAQGRAEHSATRLADGRILIAGGFGGGTTPLNTAEVYDPATGKFTSTGSMAAARQNHTATLLPNGQVLIAGGLDADNHVLALAELYDPASGTFHSTGSMATPRERHTATSLFDGRVLVAGGVGANQTTALASAEIYDSSTGTFSTTGSMKTARYAHTATALIYGQVIVAGGQGTNSLEVYWPDTGQFGYQRALLGPASAAALMTDRVLLTGETPDLYCSWPASFSPCL